MWNQRRNRCPLPHTGQRRRAARQNMVGAGGVVQVVTAHPEARPGAACPRDPRPSTNYAERVIVRQWTSTTRPNQRRSIKNLSVAARVPLKKKAVSSSGQCDEINNMSLLATLSQLETGAKTNESLPAHRLDVTSFGGGGYRAVADRQSICRIARVCVKKGGGDLSPVSQSLRCVLLRCWCSCEA